MITLAQRLARIRAGLAERRRDAATRRRRGEIAGVCSAWLDRYWRTATVETSAPIDPVDILRTSADCRGMLAYGCVTICTHVDRDRRHMLWYVAFIAAINLGLGYLWGAYVRPCPRCAKARAWGMSLLSPTADAIEAEGTNRARETPNERRCLPSRRMPALPGVWTAGRQRPNIGHRSA